MFQYKCKEKLYSSPNNTAVTAVPATQRNQYSHTVHAAEAKNNHTHTPPACQLYTHIITAYYYTHNFVPLLQKTPLFMVHTLGNGKTMS